MTTFMDLMLDRDNDSGNVYGGKNDIINDYSSVFIVTIILIILYLNYNKTETYSNNLDKYRSIYKISKRYEW